MKPGFEVLDRSCQVADSTFLEASAGTGKTFTLAHLYVRLLLKKEPLDIDQILVVTFTRAATLELKKRIYELLETSIEDLSRPSRSLPGYLEEIAEEGEEAVSLAKRRLQLALSSFDEARIFTIHGFCFHTLKEHLIESKISPSLNEKTSFNQEAAAVVVDYLRTEIKSTHFSSSQLKRIGRRVGGQSSHLVDEIVSLLSRRVPLFGGRTFETLAHLFAHAWHPLKIEFPFAKEMLADHASSFCNTTHRGGEVKREVEKALTLFSTLYESHLSFTETFNTLLDADFDAFTYFDSAYLKQKAVIPNELSSFLSQWKEKIAPLITEGSDPGLLLLRLAEGARESFERSRVKEGKLFYDDLLESMRDLSAKPEFVQHLSSRYRAVCIDEFQDTDPIQWEIFSRLFATKTLLYLIGDPKQSIYRFRQADIYTYLNAKKTLGTLRHASLDTNYRSQEALVEAINFLFAPLQEFIHLPKEETSLACPPVFPAGRVEKILEEDGRGSLHFFREKNEEALFQFLVNEIDRLYTLHDLSLSQIAILVKDRYQEERLVKYLKKKSIPVKTRRSQSLLSSPALPLLKALLSLLLEQNFLFALASLLCSPLFCCDCEQLESILGDEEIVRRFYNLRLTFAERGMIGVFNALMALRIEKEGREAQTILLSQEGGEAIYSVLLQLIEVLVEAEVSLENSEEFLTHLKNQEKVEEERLRCRELFEKEGVEILTIHRSKGLEYEIVFALGIGMGAMQREKLIVSGDPPHLHLVEGEDPRWIEHAREEEAEKMRTLYVAMTRAKQRLYVPLLEKEQPAAPLSQFLRKRLKEGGVESLLGHGVDITLSSGVAREGSFSSKIELKKEISFFKPAEENLFSPPLLRSFTSLKQKASEGVFRESSEVSVPRGAEIGIFLHRLLERIPLKESCKEYVRRSLQGTPFTPWEEQIAEWVRQALTTPLFEGATLADLEPQKIFREMEFLYPQSDSTGFLQGTIDFFCEHRGKYYLIDWKSNWLGNATEDYTLPIMQQAMEENDYFTQEKIYREAARRYITCFDRRPFQEIYGGSFFLFLRGISATTGVFKL